MTCPHCGNDDESMMEVTRRPLIIFCTICARTFPAKKPNG